MKIRCGSCNRLVSCKGGKLSRHRTGRSKPNRVGSTKNSVKTVCYGSGRELPKKPVVVLASQKIAALLEKRKAATIAQVAALAAAKAAKLAAKEAAKVNKKSKGKAAEQVVEQVAEQPQ